MNFPKAKAYHKTPKNFNVSDIFYTFTFEHHGKTNEEYLIQGNDSC